MLRLGPFLILVTLSIDFGFVSVSCLVPLTEFFPYGPTTDDTTMPPTNAQTFSMPLQTPFHFLGTTYNTIYLEENGVLPLGPAYPYYSWGMYPCNGSQGLPTVPLIAPFWIDAQTYLSGQVYYREETKDAVSLCRVTKDAWAHFRLRFRPKSLFIATWDDVPPYDELPGNTFQAVLASDGTTSLVYFLYNELPSGVGDFYHLPASVGFAPGDGVHYYQILSSCTADILQIGVGSNIGHPGQFIFQVDTVVVEPISRRKVRIPLSS